MATKTTAQLATAVMRKLGLIDTNKEPSAGQQASIIDLYEDWVESVRPMDMIYWETAAIPRAVFAAVTRIIAEEFCNSMGRDIPTEQDENGQAVSIGNRGLMMLKRHLAREQSGVPTRATYF